MGNLSALSCSSFLVPEASAIRSFYRISIVLNGRDDVQRWHGQGYFWEATEEGRRAVNRIKVRLNYEPKASEPNGFT